MSTRMLQIMVGGRIPLDITDVGEVELLEFLGGGAFGTAWRVKSLVTGEVYTLTIIQGLKPGSVDAERVRRESSVAIPSDYIVGAIGLQEWDSHTFLILFTYFQGRSLDKWLEDGGLNPTHRKQVFIQTLLGVRDAHFNNVIHRDLKPANILVNESGKTKVMDFGISKFKGSGLTMSGEIIGTLPYMAPETLLIGAKVADCRADIYALGHILYELSMGQHFWVRQGWKQLSDFASYLMRKPPPRYLIEVDDFACPFFTDVNPILLRMVALDPDERYNSVDDVLDDLGHIVDLPTPPLGLNLRNPFLIVESGSNRGARTLLSMADGDTWVMGRTDFAGADTSISREHLEFRRLGDRYFVRDLGSRNGTMIRGRMLEPKGRETELHHADRIKVGEIFLRFAFLRDS